MDAGPYYIAAGFIGIFVIALFCICLGAWAEKHGKPPLPIEPDYEDGRQ